MKTLISGCVLALVSVPAMASCPDDLNKLRTDLQNNQSFQQRYTAGTIDRTGYMNLFNAAHTFASMGLEQRCQDVLSGIREISQKTDSASPRASDRPTSKERHAERLRTARPLIDARVSWDSLLGADVRNPADTDLGEVRDVVMDKGQINGVVVERGGFLGMGQSYYLVSAGKIKISQGTDADGDRRTPIVVIDMTPDQIKSMPSLKKENGAWVTDAGTPPSTTPGSPPSRAKQ